MRALVTGGAGFLGSHLTERLLAEGFDVIGMDNFLTSTRANIEGFLDRQNYSFIEHNCTRFMTIDGPLDRIYHFASPASPRDYLQFPIQTLKVGALGTHNALGLAKGKGARILLASTSEVYGDPLVNPQHEDYWGNVNPIGPRGVYDEAKRYAEAMVMAYHRFHGVDTRIVRIFNTYGPRMRLNDGRAIPNFISQLMDGEPMTIFGDGTQTRSFCYVSDLVDGIFGLMECEKGEKIHDPVNIGNPEEKTLLEMAEVLASVAGGSGRMEYQPLPTDDPKVRRPDITRARALLGWEPGVSLREGLATTYNWYKERAGR